jgi:hypothetical protein
MTTVGRRTWADDPAVRSRLPFGIERRSAAPADPGAAPRRDHESARLRAKMMNPETAYTDLIERLNYAVVQAGKPPLSALGKEVDYSKAQLSKVLTGKAMPSWVLVQRLGEHLRMPPSVMDEWYTLWTAANMHGRQTPTAAPSPSTGTAVADGQTSYKCQRCGSWVVDTTLHTTWHMAFNPPNEPVAGWHARPAS